MENEKFDEVISPTEELLPDDKKEEKIKLPHQRITFILIMSASILVLSSFQFGYGLGELNAAEFFVPYVVPKDYRHHKLPNTVIYTHEGKNKTCHYMNSFFKDCIPMWYSWQWIILVSIFSVGGLIGALSGPLIASIPFVGRKWTIWLTTIVFIIAYLMKIVFSNYFVFLGGRLVQGIAAGVCSAVVPMYITEITPGRWQGMFGTVNQLGITAGILFTQLISIFTADGQWWRILFGWVALVSLFQFLTIPFLPPSPKFLIESKRRKKAEKSLQRLRMSFCSKPDVTKELDFIEAQKEKQENSYLGSEETSINNNGNDPFGKFVFFFKTKVYNRYLRTSISWRRIIIHLIIACVLQIIQQFSGINAIMFYSTKVYGNIFPSIATILSAVTMAVNMFSVIIAFFVIELVGRKWLLLVGIFFEIFSMLLVSVSLIVSHYAFGDEGAGGVVMGILTISSILAFIVFFEISIGPIPWFFTSELFPTNLRGIANAAAVSVNWLCVFTIGLVFTPMVEAMKMFAFLPFGFCLILGFFFVILVVPETSGKSPQEVGDLSWIQIVLFCDLRKNLGSMKKVFSRKKD